MKWILLMMTACLPMQADQLKTYFTYSDDDTHLLKGLKSEKTPTTDELNKWDGVIEELIVKQPLSDGEGSRLTAYVYAAQREYAALSQKQQGSIAGSFGPVTEGVIRLFYPRYQPKENAQDDHYTMALTMVVMEKVRDRFIDDQSRLKRSRIIRGPIYWQGDYPYYGQKIASFKPWSLESNKQYRCEKLVVVDDAFWADQIAQMKEEMKELDASKKKLIHFWADHGDWILIGNAYMDKNNVPLEKRLAARADLATGIEDAFIGAFDSKYAYCIRRPAMIDETIQTVIPAPNHPSYPSGHSTIGGASASILTHYFPENKEEWVRLREDAGMSRLWAGIHYPVDHSAGKALGERVAESTINR
jgi:hypothetical protein